MIVEVNPADVVSVPKDCSCQKLRTAKYKVVALHETIDRPLQDHLVYDYYDEDDVDERWDDEGEVSDEYNEGYAAGYRDANN
jgi:hypothetical protein